MVREGFSEDCWMCLDAQEELARGGRGRIHREEEAVSESPGTQNPLPWKKQGRLRPRPPFKAERRGASWRGRCQGPSRPLIRRRGRAEPIRRH